MNEAMLRSFVDNFKKEKEELNKKFDEINKKLVDIDKKFDAFDRRMDMVESQYNRIEGAFEQLGDFSTKMDDINIYLSQIETKLNQYKTLTMKGCKVHNGEIYILKIKLQRVKPIVNWENNEILSSRLKQIEDKFVEIEENIKHVVI